MKQGVHRRKYRLIPLYLSSKEEGKMFTIAIYSARLKGFSLMRDTVSGQQYLMQC
jgi:hypothetical protein